MTNVLRIVTNIKAENLEKTSAFYEEIFGLSLLMDHGWIQTFGTQSKAPVQISIATEGGSGTDVPDISIEVDDLEKTVKRVLKAGLQIEYGPVTEPWGVERFYVRDPFGKLLNVMQHR